MNGRLARKLRQELKSLTADKKEKQFDIHNKADYRVAHKVKKMVYFKTKSKLGVLDTVAKEVERQCVVNITKTAYRRLKKEYNKRG